MYSLELDTNHAGRETTNSYFSYVEEKLNREIVDQTAVIKPYSDDGIIVVDFLDV